MGHFIWRKSLVGMTPRTLEGVADGTIEDGDLLVWQSSDGTLAKAANEATYRTLAGVAFGGASSGGKVLYIPIDPNDVYETTSGESSAAPAGKRLKLYVNGSTQAMKNESGRLQIARTIEVVDATSKTILITFGGTAIPSS